MLSNYEEVLLPIRVPVGIYCFRSDGPFPVTCGHLDFEDFGLGGSYPRCLKHLGTLVYTESDKIVKPDACLKLRSGVY